MDVYRAIKDRRSIRKFLDLPIEQKKISMLLDAGRFAPSAGNVQDWKFIVVVGDHVKESC
jgi:nitroreductase